MNGVILFGFIQYSGCFKRSYKVGRLVGPKGVSPSANQYNLNYLQFM